MGSIVYFINTKNSKYLCDGLLFEKFGGMTWLWNFDNFQKKSWDILLIISNYNKCVVVNTCCIWILIFFMQKQEQQKIVEISSIFNKILLNLLHNPALSPYWSDLIALLWDRMTHDSFGCFN